MKPLFAFLIIIVLMIGCSAPEDNTNRNMSMDKTCLASKKGRSHFSLNKEKSFSSDSVNRRTLQIEVGSFSTVNSGVISKDVVIKACNIASEIISSEQFQNTLKTLDFQYLNHCTECSGGNVSRKDRISGIEVLDSLFRAPKVKLNFDIYRGKCNGALGSTCPNYHDITSNYKAIQCDMPDLPIEYAYAVHLCHEFAHTVGYCHTDHKDDVAEKIGWIAYHIAVEMNKSKKK